MLQFETSVLTVYQRDLTVCIGKKGERTTAYRGWSRRVCWVMFIDCHAMRILEREIEEPPRCRDTSLNTRGGFITRRKKWVPKLPTPHAPALSCNHRYIFYVYALFADSLLSYLKPLFLISSVRPGDRKNNLTCKIFHYLWVDFAICRVEILAYGATSGACKKYCLCKIAEYLSMLIHMIIGQWRTGDEINSHQAFVI